MIITIPGPPIPKARPRFSRGRVYNVQKKQEEAFVWQVMKQWTQKPITWPLALVFEFVMPIPKSTSKKNRDLMLTGEMKHIKTADIDNLIKFSLDCLNGLLFEDDRQVYWIQAIKRYGDNPRTVITERRT